MARLIDADALPKAMEYDYEKGEMKILYYDAWVIAHAPTVDAIPIEWIEEYIDHLTNEIEHGVGCSGARKQLDGIKLMLHYWRKENE